MSKTDQQDLFKPDFGWFHFFRTIIQNDTWAKMSLAAGKLYPVVKSYANAENGAAFPSYDTLAAKSGLSIQSVSKALKELADLGMITATRTVGKKTIYALKETFDVQHPVSGQRGSASFDYVPSVVQDAVKELRALVSTGAQGKIIQINFNLNCENVTSNNAQNIIDGAAEIQKIMDLLEQKQPVENS